MKTSILKIVLLLAPMVIGLPFAMDIYVPALPRIAQLFNVSAGQMQFTLTIFMLTAGLVQLVVGPLSDQYGRKKISFVVIIIFAIGSLLCSTAQSATQLIAYRMIQAAGSCGMLVIAFAAVRDLYHANESAKVYSFLNGIISFSPMFAPFIGSYLDVHLGWPFIFLSLLVIVGFALATIGIGMPETLATNKRIKFSFGIFEEYKNIGSNKLFAIYTITSAIGLSYLYLFCSISSYIIIRLLHIQELDYGYYFCFMGISFFAGSFLSAYIVGRMGIYQTVVIGFCITLLGGLLMGGWYFLSGLTINNFIWPMLLIGIGGTFCMGAGNGGAMEPFPDKAGAASALGGAFRFLFSAILGSLLITNSVSSTLPLAIPAIVFSIIGLLIFSVFQKCLVISDAEQTVK